MSSRELTSESDIDRIFGVVLQLRTYRHLLYLLLSFPLSILYFVIIVFGLSAGIGLAIVYVGLPILALTLVTARGCAALERRLAGALLEARFESSVKPAIEGWKARLKDRRSWTVVLYMLAKLPLAILSLVVAVIFAVSALMVAASILPALAPHLAGTFWIPTREESLLVACLGFALFVASAHAVNGLAALSREIAGEML